MPRPTNKTELSMLSNKNLLKLFDFIDSLPQEYAIKKYENNELNDRDTTIADILCHLHEWHKMMQNWYTIGMAGKKPAIPAEGITWQTLPILNRRIFYRYEGTQLSDAIQCLKKSHEEIMALIEKHTDNELFTKKKYVWTGTTSLGAYLVSATASHYDWALKTIKPIKKLIKQNQ